MPEKRKSEAFRAASNHWAKRFKSQAKQGPDGTQDGKNSQDSTPVSTSSTKIPSPIKLLYNPSYSEDELSAVNADTVRIRDLIGAADLKETYQFNFNVDLTFFLSFLHPDFKKEKRKILFITGSKLLDRDYEETYAIEKDYNISEVQAKLPSRFGTHHTKMMINFSKDQSAEIIIMSCNLTKLDFGGLTQMIWRSGKLFYGDTTSSKGSQFKSDLLAYLHSYSKPQIDILAMTLQSYSFQGIDVDLIASSPGSYNTNDEEKHFGYGSLLDACKRNNLLVDNRDKSCHYNILAQTSAISYPFATEKWSTAGVFTHLLCPMLFSKNSEFHLLAPGKQSLRQHQAEHNYTPSIVFPTVGEVASSNMGFASGQAIHFDYSRSFVHRNYYEQAIKPYLKKWNSTPTNSSTGREHVMPHVKLYMCDNGDNWESIRWCYMGSHNLSKQAWGSRKGNKFVNDDPSRYEVNSYELGVLLTPKPGTQMKPSYLSDSGSEYGVTYLRMPFALPPAAYSKDDIPWSGHVSYGELMDSKGYTYNLSH
ncbi:hypothetical protein KGF57_002708 [Candida theae]|uniref:PLD phosphodiesterase domain-containing protein n=1 Tax=Candida theae TaxID=1198502 RepID=A0AAD5FYW3_9ASCO|nr:uncharacterized protein KGF57_002708 [Candida theae]KAI5958352.1 hypothetical protein KGF57_002708 [Candida theae]